MGIGGRVSLGERIARSKWCAALVGTEPTAILRVEPRAHVMCETLSGRPSHERDAPAKFLLGLRYLRDAGPPQPNECRKVRGYSSFSKVEFGAAQFGMAVVAPKLWLVDRYPSIRVGEAFKSRRHPGVRSPSVVATTPEPRRSSEASTDATSATNWVTQSAH